MDFRAQKQKRIEIFEDTLAWIGENTTLLEAVQKKEENSDVYRENQYPRFQRPEKRTVVTVTSSRSFEAAERLASEHPGKKVTVLNFASPTHPGGGVANGAGAQEECLCRCSTLYPMLNSRDNLEQFYDYHRNLGTSRASDRLIYTKDVIVCKTDTLLPERMPEEDWFTVDVITCAAPHARYIAPSCGDDACGFDIGDAEQFGIHVKRALHILTVAAANGADLLVLGAFGCGAFNNNPEVVAKAYKAALEAFPKVFDVVEFAVYCAPGVGNLEVFERVFSK